MGGMPCAPAPMQDAERCPTPGPDTRLDVRDLHWGPGSLRILNGINLDVESGQFVGIIGPNGSGKSSLLRCIYRFYRPISGAVFLDGVALSDLSAREVAKRTAVVLQEFPSAFGLTVAEVVRMGRVPHKRMFEKDTKEDEVLILESLRMVGLEGFAGRDFDTLSGGEKQRVILARALAQQPKLLVLDEPTSHLDIRHQGEALRLVRRLGVAVLAAVHDLNLVAAYCDRVYVMKQGWVVARGLPEEVLTSSLIFDVFGVDSIIDTHPMTNKPRITFHH